MRFGSTLGTRRIVKAYPGLAGASVGSIFIESSKLLIRRKQFQQLRQQRQLDIRLKSSLESLDFGKMGAIVQIGANDGQHSDPMRDILVARDIRAVLVEPMPIAFKALSRLYSGHANVQ